MFNWTPNNFSSYKIGVPEKGTYKVLLDTSLAKYGGDKSRKDNAYKTKSQPIHGYEQNIDLKLHGLSALFLQKVKAPAKSVKKAKTLDEPTKKVTEKSKYEKAAKTASKAKK